MAILDVTEATLRDWIETGIAKPKIHKIGKRKFYDFTDGEIRRLKSKLHPSWKQGQPKLKAKPHQ